eukprot:1134488-Prymnesium_polylepis.2
MCDCRPRSEADCRRIGAKRDSRHTPHKDNGLSVPLRSASGRRQELSAVRTVRSADRRETRHTTQGQQPKA